MKNDPYYCCMTIRQAEAAQKVTDTIVSCQPKKQPLPTYDIDKQLANCRNMVENYCRIYGPRHKDFFLQLIASRS